MCSRVRLSPHSPRSKRLGCLYFVFMVGTLSYVLLGTLLGCHSLAVRRMVDFVSTEAGIGLSLRERWVVKCPLKAWHAKLVITDGSVTAWREGPAAVDEELRRHCTHPEE